jgi:hypothetical protein
MDTSGMVKKLIAKYRPEGLAVEMGKSVATINLWKAGKRNPDKANLDMLINLTRGIDNVGKSKH